MQFRRPKMRGLASGPVEILPYEQICGVNLNEGVFSLYSKAEAKPVISKPVGISLITGEIHALIDRRQRQLDADCL